MTDLSSIITQLESQRDAIDKALAALRGISGSVTPAPVKAPSAPKKATKKTRTISEEGRMRMAEAQRKRWAAKRAVPTEPTEPVATKKAVKKATKKATKKASAEA